MTATRRVRMSDGEWWTVERRHEMTRMARPGEDAHGRRLFLFFRPAGRGAAVLRRAEVPEDFPDEPSERMLREVWERAEHIGKSGVGSGE